MAGDNLLIAWIINWSPTFWSRNRKLYFNAMKPVARIAIFIFSLLTVFAEGKAASPEGFHQHSQFEQDDLRLSLPNISPLAYEENGVRKGFLVELAKAMDNVYRTEGVEVDGSLKNGRIIIEGVYPFKRSVRNVQQGKADFHIPFLVNPFVSCDLLEKEHGVVYSTAFIGHANFPIYATKELTVLLSGFEQKIGKKLFQLEREEDFKKLDDFILQNKILIEVNRAHTPFFPFSVSPSNNTLQSLKKLTAHRIDGYIHKMQECDTILKANGIDTSNIKKLRFMRFGGRMIIPATRKGNEIDKIISGLVWKLQDREVSTVLLSDTYCGGRQIEVPYDNFLNDKKFINSKWFAIMGAMWDIPFTKEFK